MGLSAERVQEKLLTIGNMVLINGKLDIKTKALIALSSAASVSCGHCKEQSKKIARKFGANDEEIREAEELAERIRKKCHTERAFFGTN